MSDRTIECLLRQQLESLEGFIGSYTDVISVETVADLKALPETSPDGLIREVLGYYEAGDIRTRVFTYDATSVLADNGGTVLQPASNPAAGRWIWTPDGPISVKEFGAVGDGVTDDATKIQATITALGGAGGTMLIPSGAFRLAAPIVIDIYASINIVGTGIGIVGTGVGATSVLKPDANVDGIRVATTTQTVNTVLRDFAITAAAGSTASGVVLGTGTPQCITAYTLLENLDINGFSGAGGSGVKIITAQELDIHNCRIQLNTVGVHYPAPGVWGVSGFLTSCHIHGEAGIIGQNTAQGILLEGKAGGVRVSEIVIESNGSEAIRSTGVETMLTVEGVHFEANGATSTRVVHVSGGAGAVALAMLNFTNNLVGESQTIRILDLDYASAFVQGNQYLWRGVNSVITTANTTATFINNAGDYGDIPALIAALLGTITAHQNGVSAKTSFGIPVGIGTRLPLSDLHIKDAAGSATYQVSDTLRVDGGGSGLRAEIHLTDGVTSDSYISFLPSATATSRRLSFSPSGVEADLVIQGDGKIGMGTVSPSETLDVVGTIKASGTISAADDISTTAVGKTLKIKSGSNAKAGTFTLVAGAATVSNTSITANSVVIVTLKTAGGTRAGNPDIVPTSGVGFVATGVGTDTSTYNYVVVEVN